MKRTNKKGFTIVELVIVIAVIAILAAVLIPNISKLVKKAQISSDLSLVKNLNTALSIDSATMDYPTAYDAFEAVKENGYDLTKIEAKADKNKILYDSKNKCFAYLNGKNLEYYPNSRKDNTTTPNYELWAICTSAEEASASAYSVYWNGAVNAEITVNGVGFDTGNKTVKTVTYKGGDASTNAVIRTNSFDTVLTVTTDGSIRHYGDVGTINIEKVAMASFHEYGNARVAILKKGNLEVEKEASISVISVEATESGEAKVKVEGTVTTIAANSNITISGSAAPVVTPITAGYLKDAVAIVNGMAVNSLGKIEAGEVVLLKDIATQVNVTGGTITGNMTKLNAMVSGNGNVTFKNIYTTNIKVEKDYSGHLTFDGGKLEIGERGSGDENAAFFTKAPASYTFKNMTIAANVTKGIKISRAVSVTIDNCVFDATKLEVMTDAVNSDKQSLSLVDIQATSEGMKSIVIRNSTFKGAVQGSTAVPSFIDESRSLKDSDTAAAIKIKVENGNAMPMVTIEGNTFIDNYRDIVLGTAAYAENLDGKTGRCPEVLVNNTLTNWTVQNNTTTLTQAVISTRGVATLTRLDKVHAPEFNRYTVGVENVGELNGGCGIWVISKAYKKVDDTWYYLVNGAEHNVECNNSTGTVTFTKKAN